MKNLITIIIATSFVTTKALAWASMQQQQQQQQQMQQQQQQNSDNSTAKGRVEAIKKEEVITELKNLVKNPNENISILDLNDLGFSQATTYTEYNLIKYGINMAKKHNLKPSIIKKHFDTLNECGGLISNNKTIKIYNSYLEDDSQSITAKINHLCETVEKAKRIRHYEKYNHDISKVHVLLKDLSQNEYLDKANFCLEEGFDIENLGNMTSLNAKDYLRDIKVLVTKLSKGTGGGLKTIKKQIKNKLSLDSNVNEIFPLTQITNKIFVDFVYKTKIVSLEVKIEKDIFDNYSRAPIKILNIEQELYTLDREIYRKLTGKITNYIKLKVSNNNSLHLDAPEIFSEQCKGFRF